MNITIITGGSKGIGKALAQKYREENYKVYTLSRNIVDLNEVTQISVDLTDLKATQNNFMMLLDELKKLECTSITLIHNAGRLGKVANLEYLTPEDIAKTIQLNTTIPLVLSSLFIAHTQELNCQRKIVNVSSGAAINAYEGWSVYCTSKAALDMITKCIDAEDNQVECYGIRPGVVDTAMQTQIRNTDETDFKYKQRFVDLKENQQLYTPEYVAQTIFELITNHKLISGETVDIRQL